MAGPFWLALTFAATMLAVAGYCASRLVVSRLWRRRTELDGDGVHVFMGMAMAGMLVPRLNLLGASVWEVVFGISMAWFGWQAVRTYRGHAVGARRCPHPVPHLVESAAMLYMFLAVSATGSVRPMAAMAVSSASTASAGSGASAGSAGRFPVLAFALAVFMIGYVVWTADRMLPLSAATSGTGVSAATSAMRAAPGDDGGNHWPSALSATRAASVADNAPGSPGATSATGIGSATGTAYATGTAAATGTASATGTAAAPSIAAANTHDAGEDMAVMPDRGAAASSTTAVAGCRAVLGPLLAPRCAAMCKIAMGVTMGYMLIVML
jgi:Domain of unknown function (DUF5134)